MLGKHNLGIWDRDSGDGEVTVLGPPRVDGWTWRTPRLPEGRTATMCPPSAVLPLWGVLPCPARSPLSALLVPLWMSSPAPQSLPFRATPMRSPTRSWPRGLQVLPLPGRAGTTCMGGPSNPRKGGLAAPRPLHHRARNHPTSSTSTAPQELAKARPGQQLGHVLAPEGDWRLSAVT